ncbi:MAG: hypothetical protein ACQETL_17435 [Bacteroidota bacterium]
MKKMNRKHFIVILATVFITATLMFFISPLNSVISFMTQLAIKKRLSEITHENKVIQEFSTVLMERKDLEQKLKLLYHLIKYLVIGRSETAVDNLVKRYIMSTDLFYNNDGNIAKLISYYDPYTNPCTNPLVINN